MKKSKYIYTLYHRAVWKCLQPFGAEASPVFFGHCATCQRLHCFCTVYERFGAVGGPVMERAFSVASYFLIPFFPEIFERFDALFAIFLVKEEARQRVSEAFDPEHFIFVPFEHCDWQSCGAGEVGE